MRIINITHIKHEIGAPDWIMFVDVNGKILEIKINKTQARHLTEHMKAGVPYNGNITYIKTVYTP